MFTFKQLVTKMINYWNGSRYLLWDKNKLLPTEKEVLDFEEKQRLQSGL